MVAALERLADRLDTLPLATRQEVVFQVRQFQGFLLAYNRDYLTKEGQRPDGETIGSGQYSPAYKAFKAKFGTFKQTAFIDLKFKGDYFDAFALEYLGNLEFAVVNDDAKAALLAKQYGPLLGIREPDLLAFMNELVEPQIKEFITRYLQK